MSDEPPGWAPPPPPPPPPEPPPYIPPPAQPSMAPPQPQQQYWAPQPLAPPPQPRRSSSNLIVIISAALVVVLVIAAAAAYFVIGSSYASSRVGGADSTIAGIQHIDFTAQLLQVAGGYDVSNSAFDPQAFQKTVGTFVSTVKDEADAVKGDRAKVSNASGQLGNNSWLTAPEGGDVSAARARLDHAAAALVAADSITSDLLKDGQFFQAYSQALVDLVDSATAARANDLSGSLAKLEQAKTDFAAAVPPAASPGLSSDVRQFVTTLQMYVTDFIAADNAYYTGDKTAYGTAVAKINTDVQALKAFNPTSLDSAFQDYFHPTIATYEKELGLAAS